MDFSNRKWYNCWTKTNEDVTCYRNR